MAELLRKPLTIMDWLAFQGDGDSRCELAGGELVAMSPPSKRHGRIALDACGVIEQAIGGCAPCGPVQDAGLEVDVDGETRGDVADLALDQLHRNTGL